MIPPWFTHQMSRMADLRNAPARFTADGKPVGDPNIVLRMWWEGLQGVPLDVLEAAVTHAIVTRTFFPTPAELREDADVAYRRPVGPLEPPTRDLAEPVEFGTLPTGQRIVARREAEYGCDVCADTGWAPSDDPRVPAGAFMVAKCGCWETNPVLVQRRAVQAKYASGRAR